MSPRVVSACTGYGGLEMALTYAGIAHELVAVADLDPAASKVLAARFPGVPNLGDITAVDWSALGQVDILTAGYPCQGAGLLPTPRASANENRQTRRTPSQETGAHGRSLAAEVCALLPTPTAANHSGNDRNNRGDLLLPGAVRLLPTPNTGLTPNGHGRRGGRIGNGRQSGADLDAMARTENRALWGEYAYAVKRWEAVLGRPAPEPTEPGRDGKPRLAARFTEWLMGVPAGWVCDVPGLSRNDQLRVLGNGVMYQQAAYALHLLAGVS